MARHPTIALVMIVRDEARVIERCLKSIRELIDYWVIVDTGSTDETTERVQRALNGIPGEMHQRKWRNFGHNRSEAMALARGKGDYRLWADADMTFQFDKKKAHRVLREDHADSYQIRHHGEPSYWLTHLVAGDQNWWHEGVTHEYPTTDQPQRTERLDAITIRHHADGAHRPEKFERDLKLLVEDLDRDPSNTRTAFYLANTLRDLGCHDEAVRMYHRRAQMGGWSEEVYESLYQAGVLADDVAVLFEAWSYRPSRAEPLYELAWRFRRRGVYQAAYLVAERGLGIPIPDDGLFVHRWVYEWGIAFEYSIACYWTGEAKAALAACDRLLELPTLPDNYREQVKTNRRFSEILAGECVPVAS